MRRSDRVAVHLDPVGRGLAAADVKHFKHFGNQRPHQTPPASRRARHPHEWFGPTGVDLLVVGWHMLAPITAGPLHTPNFSYTSAPDRNSESRTRA
jgi:hypothetical protein